MMAKTTEERIESVQEQIRQLENQKKRLMQEQKERERKARTKRLIERGAILESLIPEADAFTNEQIKAFLEKTIRTESARKAWANLSAAQGEPAAAKAAGAVQGGGVSALKAGASVTGEAGWPALSPSPKGALIHPCGCVRSARLFAPIGTRIRWRQAVIMIPLAALSITTFTERS